MELLVQVNINVFELFYRNARKSTNEDRDIFDDVDEVTIRNDEDDDSDDDKRRESEIGGVTPFILIIGFVIR